MDCEQAANFISARIDGELPPVDEALLDAHLAGCAACQQSFEAAELQDAAMVRAFADGREAAAALSDRVSLEIAAASARSMARMPSYRKPMQWLGWIAAAAAGFVVAVLLVRPVKPLVDVSWPPAQPAESVAHLALASGNVFTCPSGNDSWQPMSPGESVASGAKVRTASAAKCELALPGGSRLRLNSATELHFTSAREVQLSGGQIWSVVPPDGAPLRVAAGETRITAGDSSAQFDVSCAANSARVTVVEGFARVDGPGQITTVQGGQSLELGKSGNAGLAACEPIADPLQATRWLDDLLLLLPADDPELAARIDALLARIVIERTGKAVTAEPGPVERDLRARGDVWAKPIVRYAKNGLSAPAIAEKERAKRRVAGRLLIDLATASCVPDLIHLLADDDADIRFCVASALQRLTGQTLGFPLERHAATPRDDAPAAAWQTWLSRNRSRYSDRQH